MKEAKGQGSVNSGGEGAGTVTEPSTVSAVFQTRSRIIINKGYFKLSTAGKQQCRSSAGEQRKLRERSVIVLLPNAVFALA